MVSDQKPGPEERRNDSKINRKKRRRIKIIAVILVVGFIIFTVINASQDVKTVYPVKNAIENHYNIVSGYSNMSAYGSKLICWYTVGAFLHGNLNNSTINVAELMPVNAEFSLVNQTLQFPFNSLGFKIDNIKITDPSVPSGLGPVLLSSIVGGFDLSGQNWDLSPLLKYPGQHHMYLNFTVTPYSELAIYKFSGQPHHFSFEWNVTVE